MERRLAAKWFIQRGFIGWQCRRAADAPRIAGFAKVSGCLVSGWMDCAVAVAHKEKAA
ncbi:hypothetical protein [Kingella oralis]|uniref:hypothetical protein n=1 Tax=Kingella oralis TaxID=505 RepID=UPI0034E3D863